MCVVLDDTVVLFKPKILTCSVFWRHLVGFFKLIKIVRVTRSRAHPQKRRSPVHEFMGGDWSCYFDVQAQTHVLIKESAIDLVINLSICVIN